MTVLMFVKTDDSSVRCNIWAAPINTPAVNNGNARLIARRIICQVREGDAVRAGSRFGLIRFGSRTDVYLPDGWVPMVVVGQYAIGGETVIADQRAQEPARKGVAH